MICSSVMILKFTCKGLTRVFTVSTVATVSKSSHGIDGRTAATSRRSWGVTNEDPPVAVTSLLLQLLKQFLSTLLIN